MGFSYSAVTTKVLGVSMGHSEGFNPRKPAAGIPVNPPSTFSYGDGNNFRMSFGISASGQAIKKPNPVKIFWWKQVLISMFKQPKKIVLMC